MLSSKNGTKWETLRDPGFLHTRHDSDAVCNYILKANLKKLDIQYFEDVWLPGIFELLSQRRGFRHRIVIPPTDAAVISASDADIVEYVIILFFKGTENIRNWQTSEDRLQWMEKAKQHNIIFKPWIDDYAESGGGSVKITGEPSRLVHHNTVRTIRAHALPPPKWKLYIIINTGALASVLCTLYGSASSKMSLLEFPKGTITFLNLLHIVGILAYALTPTLLSLSAISAWLRLPRPRLQDMHPVHRLLDQGLEIFIAPSKEGLPTELQTRLERLEGHNDRLRKLTHELSKQHQDMLRALEEQQVMQTSPVKRQAHSRAMVTTHHGSFRVMKSERIFGTEKDPVILAAASYNSQLKLADLDTAGCEGSDENTATGIGIGTEKTINTNININHDINNTNTTTSDGKDISEHEQSHPIPIPSVVKRNSQSFTLSSSFTHYNSPDHRRMFFSKMSFNSKYEESDEDNNGHDKADSGPSPTATANTPLTMVVSHYVKWERALDFFDWTQSVTALMAEHKGFLGLITVPPGSEGEPYVNTFAFEKYECLKSFLDDPRRQEKMTELEPMLEATTVAQASQERVMHDAFSELFVSTGGSAPIRPPPMWKAFILTMLSLQMIAWPFNANLVPMLRERNVDSYIATAVVTSLNVLCSVFLGVPFLHMLFGSWLRIPRPLDLNQPWKTLDSGFTPSQRIVVIFVYFASLIVVGTLGV